MSGATPVGEFRDELRALADVLLERGQAWARTSPTADQGAQGGCEWCPICALTSTWRGEPNEFGRWLIDSGAALLTSLVAVLDEHEPQRQERDQARGERPRGGAHAAVDEPGRVQPIAVRRVSEPG